MDDNAPFVVYGDTETIINKNGEHELCSYNLLPITQYSNLRTQVKPIFFRGTNKKETLKQLLIDLRIINKQILKIVMNTNIPMDISGKEKLKMKKEAKVCYICKKDLDKDLTKRHVDHDHFNGKVRGIAHPDCNINFNLKNYKTPIFFHNLKGYDSHLIIQALSNTEMKDKIQAIPQTEEKYLTLSIGNIKFIDSMAHMNLALDALASSLPKDKFYNMKKNFGDKAEMLMRKGVYPYEYMSSFDKFNETQLPPIEKFYSSLKQDTIKQEDYDYALKVWKEMNIKNLGEWHDLYLTIDVLILADVFENYRNTCYEYYGLDPACYLTAPSLAWDAMQKSTNCKLENLTDRDMYLLFRKNLRGGMCTTGSKR